MKLQRVAGYVCNYYYFSPGENPWWLKNYKNKLQNLFGSEPYSLPVVINKTIMQQNRIKTLHHNGNPLE